MPDANPVAEYVKGLRDLADAIEQDADLAGENLAMNDFEFSILCVGADEIAAVCRQLGGIWRKQTNGSYFELVRRFGPHRISVWASRGSVCERVQVGTKTVERPDPEVEVPTITVEEPVYEFVCPDSLLEATGERDAA